MIMSIRLSALMKLLFPRWMRSTHDYVIPQYPMKISNSERLYGKHSAARDLEITTLSISKVCVLSFTCSFSLMTFLYSLTSIITTLLFILADVLLLADVFEAFREVSLSNYDLDPAHYVSSPQLSWDAMLHMTGCELELICDKAMYSMIDDGLRGGVWMISQRYAKANNKYMGDCYNPSEPSSYIMYLDANNLYGWAMSQPMPEREFKWVDEEEFSKIDWTQQTADQPIGYFVECDLDYPAAMHDKHNDYPLAPEKFTVDFNCLSETQVSIRRNYSMSQSGSNVKLVPNLLPKKNYTVHSLNLKFYLEHGMLISKIHRVISFRQSRWLAPYIKKNQDLRAAARSEFEKDFFKLMNNAVYGKTCENMKKRTDIQLLTDEDKAKKLAEKPNCLGFKIFSENLVGVNMRKVKVVINKPFYVGFAVLELSKLHMYDFHYNYMVPKYGAKAQLLFTDTDSLMYLLETEDAYLDIFNDRHLFDLASYPKSSPFFDATNNKVTYLESVCR